MQTIPIDSGEIKTLVPPCPTGITTICIANAAVTHTYSRDQAGISLADFMWDFLRAGFVIRRDGDRLIITYSNIGELPTLVEWSRA